MFNPNKVFHAVFLLILFVGGNNVFCESRPWPFGTVLSSSSWERQTLEEQQKTWDDPKFSGGEEKYYIKHFLPYDDRRDHPMSALRIPEDARVAQNDAYVFVDSWGNTIYFVSSEEYNPGENIDFRNPRKDIKLDAACAYEMQEGKRFIPYKPTTFQIISFGPDGTTITPSAKNGSFGSMINTDNDNDGKVDEEDSVWESDFTSNNSDDIAEDDITNFM